MANRFCCMQRSILKKIIFMLDLSASSYPPPKKSDLSA